MTALARGQSRKGESPVVVGASRSLWSRKSSGAPASCRSTPLHLRARLRAFPERNCDAIILGAGISGFVSASVLHGRGAGRILAIDEYRALGGNDIDCPIGPYTFSPTRRITRDTGSEAGSSSAPGWPIPSTGSMPPRRPRPTRSSRKSACTRLPPPPPCAGAQYAQNRAATLWSANRRNDNLRGQCHLAASSGPKSSFG